MHHSGQKRRAPSNTSWGSEKRFKAEESKEAREARKLQEEIDRLSMQLGAVEEKLNAKAKPGSEPDSEYSDLDNELHDLVDSDSYDEAPTTPPPKIKKPHRETKTEFRESRGELRESRTEYHREPRSDHREVKYESSRSSNSSSSYHHQSSPPEERRVSKRVTKPTNKYRSADNGLDVLDVESPQGGLLEAQPGAAAPKPRRVTTPKAPKKKKCRVIFQTPVWEPILKSSNPSQNAPSNENVPLADALKKSVQSLTAEKSRLERSLSDLEAQCSRRATDNNESEDKSPPLRSKQEFETNKSIPDYSDRCRLCNAINGLQDKYMAGVVSIFQEEHPTMLKKPQNLTCDIDIDALPPLIVRRLLAYIDDCKEADNRAMNLGGEGTGPIETLTNGSKIGNDSTLAQFEGGESNGITYPPPKTETVEGTDKKSSSSTASSETSDTSSSEDDSD